MADAEDFDTGTLPTVITSAGIVPTPPVDLRAELVQTVALTNPGYTANLPGTLIEDIASTDTQALVMIDQARVEALNSLTPFGCNEFVLMLLGRVYGVTIGQPTNTSVFVVFTGLPGFVIGKGFTVSDGRFQYVVQDGGIVGEGGQSPPLYCVALSAGSWAVPAGTVTGLVTPPPTTFTLAVTNPSPGIPATMAETPTLYRSRVLRAGLAASQGMARYLRTLLSNVEGVQERLIGVQQLEGGWLIMVGGGDPYVVAYTIYQALFDISTLVGGTLNVVSVTKANPGVVTTDLEHGFYPNDPVTITDATPPTYNGTYRVISTPTLWSFGLGKAYVQRVLSALTWLADVATVQTTGAHGVTVGSTVTLINNTPEEWNVTGVVTTVPNTTTFTFALVGDPGPATVLGQLAAGNALFDTTAFADYETGGIVTPNPARSMEVTITDFPDSYLIRYLVPAQQSVTAVVSWDTNSPNFVSPVAISQVARPALANYINSINVGQPINILQMSDAFQNAVVALLPPAYLTSLRFQIAINGISRTVEPNTHIIKGDPRGFFFSVDDDFSVVQS